jgi:hypothetical protein
MTNGGRIGPANIPTASVASGVWKMEEALDASKLELWPGQITRSGLVMAVNSNLRNSYSGSGTSMFDTSSSATTFTSTGAPTFTSGTPAFFTFNGSSNFFTSPEVSALNTNTPSVEVWVKTANTNQNGFWFEKGQVNGQYSLFQEGTTIVWRTLAGGSSTSLTVSSTTHLSTSAWKHVVGTYNGSTKIIYVNGTNVASVGQTGTMTTNANGMSIGVYGGVNGSRGYYYNGSLSEVRVYNKALSAAEVLNNFNATRSFYGV